MSQPTAAAGLIEAQFNHLVLPARVPSRCDSDLSSIEAAITDRLLEACRVLRDTGSGESYFEWDSLRRTVLTTKTLNLGGKLDKQTLLQEFRHLEPDALLILHVAEQNAGLLVRRTKDADTQSVLFEAFEASPRSSDVLAAEAALQWDFPGTAVTVPYSTFTEDSFQDSLASFLQQCSTESIKRFAARATKAGSSAIETRDSVDPTIICSFLMTLLEVYGRRTPTTLLRKRVRDTACWDQGAENPWRRLPFWLVLRVGLARYLASMFGGEVGRLKYKFFVCLVLSRLLSDGLDYLDPQRLSTLKAKLARRLAKLEIAKIQCSPKVCPDYDTAFEILGPIFHTTLHRSKQHIEAAWAKLKDGMRKRVPPLPRRADESSLILSLPNSRAYLNQVLQYGYVTNHSYIYSAAFTVEAASQMLKPLADRCFALSQLELDVEDAMFFKSIDSYDPVDACIAIDKKIEEYVGLVGSAYDGNPEQKSIMILTLLELWTVLDRHATNIFGLLLAFCPGIAPESLDILQLPRLLDMRRLLKVQSYLRERQENNRSTKRTIFDSPSKNCFAARFFDESDAGELHDLYQRIKDSAKTVRRAKEGEWRLRSKEYEQDQKRIAESTCILMEDGTHDFPKCTRCFLRRRARRYTIDIHEDFLPLDPVHAKTVVFEMRCPPVFAAYRNSTWTIFGVLARQELSGHSKPRSQIHTYRNLARFAASKSGRITLASRTKSFLDTHYRTLKFPVDLQDVCKPHGLKWDYFDNFTEAWLGEQKHKPSFAHHCQIQIPPQSPFASLRLVPEFSADGSGRTSNQVISSQTQCPSGLNPYEYMAYQSLFSGSHRRWPLILIELGSSNLNFGTEANALLMNQLSAQAGPAYKDDPLRTNHQIFRQESFCESLLNQLCVRIDAISMNWRETNSMDMLITLLLRLLSLTGGSPKAFRLLEKVRGITYIWIGQLRAEIHKAEDSNASRRCSRYALWAALLCKRTFAPKNGRVHTPAESFSPKALQQFIESCITLQDNITNDPEVLPEGLRVALVRDLKMTYRMRFLIRQTVQEDCTGLTAAINNVWPQSTGFEARKYSEPVLLDQPCHFWVQLKAEGAQTYREQMIYYELLEGHLLIDGKPLGRLPSEHRDSVVLTELFGYQSLLIYPSSLPGMTYQISFMQDKHEVHIGFRGGAMFVRARVDGKLLEHIPRSTFVGRQNYDLPASLVDDCVHWLDLRTGVLEIRSSESKWRLKKSNWTIDLRTCSGSRRRSSLVDPNSRLFYRIAGILGSFEDPRFLTVYQPPNFKPLTVELRRLELSFHVNKECHLWCKELKAEVDPDQDAGTWYGLTSKIVLRDAKIIPNRSVIVPMGPLRVCRNKFHVSVFAQPNGYYAKYAINQVLGRLDCPTDPSLLFLKAQLHAYTSSVLPDPLTGRTGVEESLHFLKSGICQPWSPLQGNALQSLASISSLTPSREYYPKGLKVMQRTQWHPSFTTTIQRDEFLPLVRSILQKSSELAQFSSSTSIQPKLRDSDSHLLQRGLNQRQLYERRANYTPSSSTSSDLSYEARDRLLESSERENAFESVTLIAAWSTDLPTPVNLAEILESWPTIQGHGHLFDRVLLSDHLNINFAVEWGSLVDYCRASSYSQRYRLSFMFGILSFRANVNMDIIRTLIAFTISDQLKKLDPPKWPSYSHFRRNDVPSLNSIVRLMGPCIVPYKTEDLDGFALSTQMKHKIKTAREAYEEKAQQKCKEFANFILKQWPCAEPKTDGFTEEVSSELNVSQALAMIKPEWLRLFQNTELARYTKKVQQILNHFRSPWNSTVPELGSRTTETYFSGQGGYEVPFLTTDLLRKSMPERRLQPLSQHAYPIKQTIIPLSSPSSLKEKENAPIAAQSKVSSRVSSVNREVTELEAIVTVLAKSKSSVRKQYAEDLKQSMEALKSLEHPIIQAQRPISEHELSETTSEAARKVKDLMERIMNALERDDPRAKWLTVGGLWPCITTVTLLEQLRTTSVAVFGTGLKESLVEYALSITQLQRLLRLSEAASTRDDKKFKEEQAKTGHENWQPVEHLDWLLLEIEANVLIRPSQVDVALATISPSSGSNSVLQMNMGQGKTSCVMPMVAASLANTKRLVRLVVPKALLLQTAQLLHARLGGLLGRELRHVPFSRKTSTSPKTTKAFWQIHKDIKHASGLMLALPEHIMSFMLSGLQRVSDNRIPEATPMIGAQAWMSKVCRDILDESDFTLAVRTQLIYPSGQQTAVDGHPQRWETAEALLKMVQTHLWSLHDDFPRSIEVVKRSAGGFPLVFFLRKDAEDALITRLVNDIMRGQTSTLPTCECSYSERQAIRHYITAATISQSMLSRINSVFEDNPIAKRNLHLLRGLIVHRILILTLKKRWSVQYGLHPLRDPIAVPYHAKGVPSDQAEWGHPDVAILFTCLSFYYEGLTISQLRQSLEYVQKSDDPGSEYDRWMHSGGNIPGSLREWDVINVDDEAQLYALWQHLRFSIVAIDHFLNHFVFPRHAKQFKLKLQSSGWDIPLGNAVRFSDKPSFSHQPLTTGFSGTNDNRTLLPLTIKQHDLPGLSHTNAEVLTYLLQERNRRYILVADSRGRRLSEIAFLHKLKDRNIHMLIDAGAQILEMDNRTLAKEWLRVDNEAKAALFFGQDNSPYIMYRNGKIVSFLASPFTEDLTGCLVYLDEAHTRGTDLKMPSYATGALTLGLGQTKDHTVQAAMRLRQLATTQSVVFFATPEVHQSILDLQKLNWRSPLSSYDVVCWLVEQTCNGIEELQPLYYSQGMDFCRRSQALIEHPAFLSDANQRESYLKELRQTEHQTLEQLYKPKAMSNSPKINQTFSPLIREFTTELNRRKKGFQDNGKAVHGSALQEVEQEREVAHEVENVREVQKPIHYVPLEFGGLHEHIIRFAETGRLPSDSAAYEHMFASLSRTALGRKYRINKGVIQSKLFVSKEFLRTIKLLRANDNFLRQVNWVLWSMETDSALIVVPEEAELLIPLVRKPKKPATHLLTYAAPVTRKMLHFNDLTYLAIPDLPTGWKAPDWLKAELGLFAGRLYFEFDEYPSMTRYLGQRECDDGFDMEAAGAPHDHDAASGASTDHNEHITATVADHECQKPIKKNQAAVGFTAKPLTFLQEWLAVRRRGTDFTHTPMGYVCHGKALNRDHPFFAKAVGAEEQQREQCAAPAAVAPGNPTAIAEDEDDDDDDEDEFDGVDEGDLWHDAEDEKWQDAEEEFERSEEWSGSAEVDGDGIVGSDGSDGGDDFDG